MGVSCLNRTLDVFPAEEAIVVATKKEDASPEVRKYELDISWHKDKAKRTLPKEGEKYLHMLT